MNLVAMLEDYTKQDIQEIAAFHGMKGYTRYAKGELAQITAEHMMSPEVLEAFFAVLRDCEIEVLEKTLKNGGTFGIQDTENTDDFERLIYAGYAFLNEDDSVSVPADLAGVYESINTEAFQERRKTISFLYDCMVTSELLYGAAPLSIVARMFNEKKAGMTIDEKTVLETAERLPQGLMTFGIQDNLLIHQAFLQDDIYKNLIRAQGNKAYYMPSLEEISDYSAYGFLRNEPHLVKLEAYLTDTMSIEAEDACNACGKIQSAIGNGCKLEEVFHLLEQETGAAKTSDELSKLVNDVWNHTRMVANRGYTPLEMNIQMVQNAGKKGRLVKRQERRVQKIYPNAPCPCGSGRKYKHCCGRN